MTISRVLDCAACVVLAVPVLGQVPQVLESTGPRPGGEFGRGVEVEGDFLAITSNEIAGSPPELGKVDLYERDANGVWVHTQQFGRRPHFNYPNASSKFGNDATIVGDSMMIEGFGGPACWEFKRINGQWQPHEEIVTPNFGIEINGISNSAYDGVTLVTGYHQAGTAQQQPDPNILFWERQGTWVVTRRFTATELGLTTFQQSRGLGLQVAVYGDVAAVAAPDAHEGGLTEVGLVATFRRVNGEWTFDRILRRPATPTTQHRFGGALAMDESVLFIGCGRDLGNVGSVYVYRTDPLLGWQLDTRIFATAPPTAGLPSFAIGATPMTWIPPTLAVTAAGYRIPLQSGNPNVGGIGATLLFELCDGDIWNQRVGFPAPLALGTTGMGSVHDSMDYDGHTIVAASPYAFQFYPDQGIAAVVDVLPRTLTECDEVGRPVCTPAALETTDCPCGAIALPGRGCPNSAGPGARLFAHGGFNESIVRRVIGEDLPPSSLVLLHVSQGIVSVLPAGQVAGDGILCVAPTVARTVGMADAAGIVVFDDVQIRPPLPFLPLGFSGYQQPLQAVYRSPLPGPCDARWNATNAIQFTISTLGIF